MNAEKKPTIPEGKLALKVGEKVQKGDWHWIKGVQKWQEVAEAINITVTPLQEGLYCR